MVSLGPGLTNWQCYWHNSGHTTIFKVQQIFIYLSHTQAISSLIPVTFGNGIREFYSDEREKSVIFLLKTISSFFQLFFKFFQFFQISTLFNGSNIFFQKLYSYLAIYGCIQDRTSAYTVLFIQGQDYVFIFQILSV